MGTKDATVRIALDGSGKRIKNYVAVGVPQSDGTYVDQYIQCTALVDSDGNEVSFEATNDLLRQLLEEVRVVRQVLGEVLDSPSAMLGRDGLKDNIVDDGNNERDELNG